MSVEEMLKKKMEDKEDKENGFNTAGIIELNTNIRMPVESQIDSVLQDYKSARVADAKHIMDSMIGQLEKGIINVRGNTYHNEEIANRILGVLIEAEAIGPNEIKSYQFDEPIDDEWVQEVKAAVKQYADDIIYDSCIMWCEALEWDRKMCKPILDGSNGFFRQIEALGYPHLCLLVKAVR